MELTMKDIDDDILKVKMQIKYIADIDPLEARMFLDNIKTHLAFKIDEYKNLLNGRKKVE